MKQRELERLLKKWQVRLRLIDWDIRILFGNSHELGRNLFDTNTYIGRMKGLDGDGKVARLIILSPKLWSEGWKDYKDESTIIEETIIHELLHVYLYPLTLHLRDNDSTSYGLLYKYEEEKAIECLAQAFLSMGVELSEKSGNSKP